MPSQISARVVLMSFQQAIARLKKLRETPEPVPTKPSKGTFVGFDGSHSGPSRNFNSANPPRRLQSTVSISQAVGEYHERVRRGFDANLAYSFAVDTACKILGAPPEGICATCGKKPIKALLLMDGATVCLERLDCLVAYGTARKLQGVQLLLDAGLPPPVGLTLPDGSNPPVKTERK
jgi:hypothetical protein